MTQAIPNVPQTGRVRWRARLFLILAGAVSVFAQSDPASSKTDVQQITDLEQRRAAAVVHRDIDLLDRLTAADSVRILPNGTFETKSQLLSGLKSQELIYTAINVDQLSVKIFSNTAVVTGKSEFQGQRNGKPFRGRCRFSRVWIRSGTGWQEVLFQLTTLPEQATAAIIFDPVSH